MRISDWSSDVCSSDLQALAELGFIVVAIDGMCSQPWRNKAFHDAYAANIGDNTIPDQVAGIKQLAARHAWIDLDRGGMWGHSGGGTATATAMLRSSDRAEERRVGQEWFGRWRS